MQDHQQNQNNVTLSEAQVQLFPLTSHSMRPSPGTTFDLNCFCRQCCCYPLWCCWKTTIFPCGNGKVFICLPLTCWTNSFWSKTRDSEFLEWSTMSFCIFLLYCMLASALCFSCYFLFKLITNQNVVLINKRSLHFEFVRRESCRRSASLSLMLILVLGGGCICKIQSYQFSRPN